MHTVHRIACPVDWFLAARRRLSRHQGAEGSTPAEKRSAIQSETKKTLGELYAAKPETKDKVAKSVGYGYFSNVNVNLLVLSTENGYGVVHDNASGKDTYMKMAGAGVGLGMGARTPRDHGVHRPEGDE